MWYKRNPKSFQAQHAAKWTVLVLVDVEVKVIKEVRQFLGRLEGPPLRILVTEEGLGTRLTNCLMFNVTKY